MMQKDTDLNFREIHGSEDAFLAAVDEIERAALIERPFHLPISLRFITPCPDSKTGHDYIITDTSTHRTGSVYVAVSYTWLHEQSLNGQTIPDYRVRDLSKAEAVPRPPHCPPIVFHRAMKYAHARGFTYVWIDQECIHQDDPIDVERHLQVMHRIYSNSKVTIAVLATTSGTIDLPTARYFKSSLNPTSYETTDQSAKDAVFQSWFCDVSNDRWFSRTWAFQEKLSAEHLEFLLPLTVCTSVDSTDYEDLCIDIARMWTIAGWSSITSAVSVEKQVKMMNHMDNNRSRPAPRRLVLESIVDIYEQMEQCENSVLADRLAILANICDLPFRLASTKLNHSQYGYSTCLVVLIFANVWPDREKRQMKYKELSNDLMDAPVGILLSYLAWQISVDGLDSKLRTERWAYESYIKKYHEHRVDLERVRDSYKARSRTVSRRVSLESMGGRSQYDSRHPNLVSLDPSTAPYDPTAVRGFKWSDLDQPNLLPPAIYETTLSDLDQADLLPPTISETTLSDNHLRVGKMKGFVMRYIRFIFKRK
jgi:hypothetical protein